jgi:phospholipid/cholesterol/gamma-HCH transport system permease protein
MADLTTPRRYRRGFVGSALSSRDARVAVESSGGYQRLRNAGDMGALGLQVIREAIRPPFPWFKDAVVMLSTSYRRCIVPLAISHAVYVIGFGVLLFGALVSRLGISERIGGALFLAWDREFCTWVTAMVFAGVVGSYYTADIGARKIREELDALAVLGVRQVKTIVVPRVIASTVALPALAFICLLIVQLCSFVLAPPLYGFSHGVYLDDLRQTIVPIDLYYPMFVKNLLLGFFIGVVGCYKGLTSRPGADGVGRAVNETVLITFFGVWLFNSLFNLAYLSLLTDLTQFKG